MHRQFRVRNYRAAVLPLLAFILICTGEALVQGAAQNSTPGLTGHTWQLIAFHGSDGNTLTSDVRNKYTIALADDGSVVTRIDCNRGRGTWKSEAPNQLTFGPMALTRAMCPPAPLTDRLPMDWSNVRSYTIKDGHLFLSLMANSGTYEFEPEPPASDASVAGADASPELHSSDSVGAVSLENTEWKLTELQAPPVTSASGRHQAYLTLDPKTHRVRGSGGCNQFTGGYELNGDHLDFTKVASTMMACMQGMDTEHAFLEALGHVQSWKIVGAQLILMDSSGQPIAHLEPRNSQ